MELMLTKTVNNVPVDGYYDQKQAWFTRTQIGEALEYTDPNNHIGKIHERHKERLDAFSRVRQFVTPSGVQQGIVYNIRGVLEICRWSRQPKADMIMDALYDMAEQVMEKGYYSRLTDEQLLNVLIQRQIDNPDFANKISRTSLRSEAVKTARPERQEKCDELFNSRMVELTEGEYALALREICKDDGKLYDGEMKRYAERVALLNLAKAGLKKMLENSRKPFDRRL